MMTRELNYKEHVFVKWFLGQQKKSFIVLSVGMSPFVLFAIGGLFYALKEKIRWFETFDFIVLFGVLVLLFLLLRLAVNIIRRKLNTDFNNTVYQFSGLYHIEKTGSITHGVDTTMRTPIMAHKIGDNIISGNDSWQFKEGEFYEFEGIPIKFSKMEIALYKSSHYYLMLTRKTGSNKLSVEDDIDSGLLKTNKMVPIVILIMSIFYIFLLVIAFMVFTNEYYNKILIGISVIIGFVNLIQIIKLVRRNKLLKIIKKKNSHS